MRLVRNLIRLFDPRERWKLALVRLFLLRGSLLEIVGVGVILPFIKIVSEPEAILQNARLGPLLARYNIGDGRSVLTACVLFLVLMTFEDLESWQKAKHSVRATYALTRGGQICRDFGICGQIQRASVSIMSNIAEGFERLHLPGKLQFYNVARSSTAEVRSLSYVIEDNFPLHASAAAALRVDIVSVSKLVTALIRSTESRRTSGAAE